MSSSNTNTATTPINIRELITRAEEIAFRFIAATQEIAAQVKPGVSPASKSSIEAMPVVEVTEENGVRECPICLEEIGIGGKVKEMPCKHGFHSDCIVKWLGIHGSCPVCRFVMPVEEEKEEEEEEEEEEVDGGEGEGRRQRRRVEIDMLWFQGRRGAGSGSDGDGSEREMAFIGGLTVVVSSTDDSR